MKNRSQLFQKYAAMLLCASCLLASVSCEEPLEQGVIGTGEKVNVSFTIGFACEIDGAVPSSQTAMSSQTARSCETGGGLKTARGVEAVETQVRAVTSTVRTAASTQSEESSRAYRPFDVRLKPAGLTKAATHHPDKFYNLDLYQYRADGRCIASFSLGSVDAGSRLNASLDSNGGETCQLLILARGATGAVPSLAGKSLDEVHKITADAATINAIDAASGNGINNMPYLLYLPEVAVRNGLLTSPEGTDVRLLLQRLAVGLQLEWSFSREMEEAGYVLKEIRLMQVPKDYRILPERETQAPYGEMYPPSVSEFVDGFRLKGDALTAAAGRQILWLPANARGVRTDINYPIYRNKDYAHSAATYVEFVIDHPVRKERLFYRAYPGGNETSDFNLRENTNYQYTIRINQADYTGDPRIQLLDQTPVISTNLVATSNCLLMRPGTNSCFNPYKHEAGAGGWNTYLASGGTLSNDKKIAEVKIFWQNKDAGTSGNLVMGYVVDATNHTNLVNFVDDPDVEKVRVHVKVPESKGGNAVLAAFNSAGTIVWSWNLWITDYLPLTLPPGLTTLAEQQAALSNAQQATEGGTVHMYGGPAWEPTGAFFGKVLMDRNLGALRNTYSTASSLDAARAYGNLYQWGRKDPIPGSADGSKEEINTIFDGDGVSLSIEKVSAGGLDYTVQHPKTFCVGLSLDNSSWGPDAKTIYDPCPKGWRVPDFTESDSKNIFKSITALRFLIANRWFDAPIATGNITEATFAASNGFLYNETVWFPAFRLREVTNGNLRDPWFNGKFNSSYLPSYAVFGARASGTKGYYIEFKPSDFRNTPSAVVSDKPYGFSVRCVQE